MEEDEEDMGELNKAWMRLARLRSLPFRISASKAWKEKAPDPKLQMEGLNGRTNVCELTIFLKCLRQIGLTNPKKG